MHVLASGERVFLRQPTASDEPEFLALCRESRELHAPWEPVNPDAGTPTAFARLLEQANTARHQKHLVCRLDDGRICGYVGLNEIVHGAFRSAYLGYWTGLPYIRRGYASEAVKLAVARAFGDLRLHRLEANIIPTNAASRAVARRCGMYREGYSRRYLEIAGSWQDHERWALTVEDWSIATSLRQDDTRPSAAICQHLVREAKVLRDELAWSPRDETGAFGAALLSSAGSVHTGISIDLPHGIGSCAEHSAVVDMLKHRHTRVIAIVAVGGLGIVVPCSRCQELLIRIDADNAKAVVILEGGRTALLQELSPRRVAD